jgi:hypothetical protein
MFRATVFSHVFLFAGRLLSGGNAREHDVVCPQDTGVAKFSLASLRSILVLGGIEWWNETEKMTLQILTQRAGDAGAFAD